MCIAKELSLDEHTCKCPNEKRVAPGEHTAKCVSEPPGKCTDTALTIVLKGKEEKTLFQVRKHSILKNNE